MKQFFIINLIIIGMCSCFSSKDLNNNEQIVSISSWHSITIHQLTLMINEGFQIDYEKDTSNKGLKAFISSIPFNIVNESDKDYTKDTIFYYLKIIKTGNEYQLTGYLFFDNILEKVIYSKEESKKYIEVIKKFGTLIEEEKIPEKILNYVEN